MSVALADELAKYEAELAAVMADLATLGLAESDVRAAIDTLPPAAGDDLATRTMAMFGAEPAGEPEALDQAQLTPVQQLARRLSKAEANRNSAFFWSLDSERNAHQRRSDHYRERHGETLAWRYGAKIVQQLKMVTAVEPLLCARRDAHTAGSKEWHRANFHLRSNMGAICTYGRELINVNATREREKQRNLQAMH